MARPSAEGLRERMVEAVERGRTQVEVAAFFGLGLRTVERYLSRWRENGQFARGKFGGHKKHLLAAHAEGVGKLVTAAPDLTLAALCGRLAAQGARSAARRWIVFCARQASPIKTLVAAEQKRREVQAARSAWQAEQKHLEPSQLVFIDETWVTTNTTRVTDARLRANACSVTLLMVTGKRPPSSPPCAILHRGACGLRHSHQWRELRGLGASVSGVDTATGRHCRAGQSLVPQNRRGA